MPYETPEQQARRKIEDQLSAAGWEVQDHKRINLNAKLGVAVREFPLQEGFADYMLFCQGKAVGVIEAKRVGATLGGVAEQSASYAKAGNPALRKWSEVLPFTYESTGIETFFRDLRDPDSRSRRVFAFHQPETMLVWVEQATTLRARLRQLPALPEIGLRQCQVTALTNLEKSLAAHHPRSLLQMATGSGKTFTAVSACYRLIKFGGAKRILFLVDRGNLGKQTLKEFQQYLTPDDGRKFTELYNVQRLTSRQIDPVAKVTISTIQRAYSLLSGNELDEAAEERSGYEADITDGEPREVRYNPLLPIETYDFIIVDECHRSIYNLWRQVLEYFDAFLIGLTATPAKQTLGFFNQNLVTEYAHEHAVTDGVNVGYDIYRIKTRITTHGAQVDAGFHVEKRDRKTRKRRWVELDETLEYEGKDLDRSVITPDQIRTVIRSFRDKLFTELVPGRTWVPKTLIFAKSDDHADRIVEIVREEFGRGNDFCKKITYRVTGEDAETLIQQFRTAPEFRIAVTVDMISTGTDIKPLECLLFLRDVKSQVYFEQMKGRGTRTLDPTDLQAVTPDAKHKTHFMLVDAVGVTEHDKTDSRALERKPNVAFEKLLLRVATGARDTNTLTSLANRLARLDRTLAAADREKIHAQAGQSVARMSGALLAALDPDQQESYAQTHFAVDKPDKAQLKHAREALSEAACGPFHNPDLRDLLEQVRREQEETIDHLSKDEVLFAGADTERAQTVVRNFQQFIADNRDELTALQLIYNQPYARRHATYEQIQSLAEAIGKPPYHLAPQMVWQAYAHLERAKVRGAGPVRLLTDLISLVRFATGSVPTLEHFEEVVTRRFEDWLVQQQHAGRDFTPEQLDWLHMIKTHVAASLHMTEEDLELSPFAQKGGLARVRKLFGQEFQPILNELNEVLAA